jgi:hypothetical protein
MYVVHATQASVVPRALLPTTKVQLIPNSQPTGNNKEVAHTRI